MSARKNNAEVTSALMKAWVDCGLDPQVFPEFFDLAHQEAGPFGVVDSEPTFVALREFAGWLTAETGETNDA